MQNGSTRNWRRERVIRIFRTTSPARRLIGALLAEYNENWQERRYLDMDELRRAAARAAVPAMATTLLPSLPAETIRHPTNQKEFTAKFDLTLYRLSLGCWLSLRRVECVYCLPLTLSPTNMPLGR